MAQTQEAVFYHGNQLNMDYTPVAAVAAGQIVPLGDNLVGYANIAIPAGKQGALDVGQGMGVYKIKKDAVDEFTRGDLVDWDDTNHQAEPNGGANSSFGLGVCVEDAAASDDFVLVMPLSRDTAQSGILAAAAQALGGPGAVNVTSYLTKWTTTGADAGTLADGRFVNQLKKVQLVVDGGDGTLTPENFANGTTITFADVGDFVLLLWDGTNWNAVEVGNDADGVTGPVIA